MNANQGPALSRLRGAVDLSSLAARRDAPQAPAGGAGAAPQSAPADSAGLVFQVGDADFGRVIELSSSVPVVVALVASWSTPSAELITLLTRAVTAQQGKLVLATVDTDANPQLTQAFQAQSVPTVAAVIAGAPVALFAGVLPEDQLGPLFTQLLELAAQQGVTGRVGEAPAAAEAEPVPDEQPLPPHHAEAYAAIDRGDYATAASEFRTAIAQNPRDLAAVAALAQVELLSRLSGADPVRVRAAAAADPRDLDAALAVADLDLSGGHVEDAFARLLDLVPRVFGADRDRVRARLIDFFEIVGVDDPRVTAARRKLTSLLY